MGKTNRGGHGWALAGGAVLVVLAGWLYAGVWALAPGTGEHAERTPVRRTNRPRVAPTPAPVPAVTPTPMPLPAPSTTPAPLPVAPSTPPAAVTPAPSPSAPAEAAPGAGSPPSERHIIVPIPK